MNNRLDRCKFDLADLYEKGDEIPQDLPAAVAIYTEDAQQDYKQSIFASPAQLKLCQLYMTGEGVPQDYGQAKTWCMKSASGGMSAADLLLGRMAEQGAGGQPKDPQEALLRYQRAAAGMLPDAYMELGRLRAANPAHDYQRKAYFWFLLAQRKKFPGADAKLQQASTYLSNAEMDDELKQSILWNKTYTAFRLQMAYRH
jgi:TPR repeat protein